MLLDIFSRYVPGWLVATAESAALAERLIADSVAKQAIPAGQLTIHADRGSSMTSRPVALLLGRSRRRAEPQPAPYEQRLR